MKDIASSMLIDLINWLNGLRSVTDFETYAISRLREVCKDNNIATQDVEGGLHIGNPNASVVFMAHVDRVGFVATGGKLENGALIDIFYVSQSASITPQSISEKFSRALLVGYHPLTGEDLFIASLRNDKNSYQAEICSVLRDHHQVISKDNPIPMTAVRSALTQVGDYLQGYFDNSAGLAIALLAVAKYPQNLSCMITVAEEGGGYLGFPNGGRGAQKYIRHHDLNKLLVVLDVRPSGLYHPETSTRVGKGVVLREAEWRKSKEGGYKLLLGADKKMLEYIKQFATRNDISYQTYGQVPGGGITEAGRAYEVLGQEAKLRCIWLQPPIANEHSQFEVVSLLDLQATLQLAEELRNI